MSAREAELQALRDVERLVAAADGDRIGVEATQRRLRRTLVGLFSAAKQGGEERKVLKAVGFKSAIEAVESARAWKSKALRRMFAPSKDEVEAACRVMTEAWRIRPFGAIDEDAFRAALAHFVAERGAREIDEPDPEALERFAAERGTRAWPCENCDGTGANALGECLTCYGTGAREAADADLRLVARFLDVHYADTADPRALDAVDAFARIVEERTAARGEKSVRESLRSKAPVETMKVEDAVGDAERLMSIRKRLMSIRKLWSDLALKPISRKRPMENARGPERGPTTHDPSYGVSPVEEGMRAQQESTAEHARRIMERRTLASQLIRDMQRLHDGWDGNSLTKVVTNAGGKVDQPLTVTLDATQINALVIEFKRLEYLASRVQDAAYDHELDPQFLRSVGGANA